MCGWVLVQSGQKNTVNWLVLIEMIASCLPKMAAKSMQGGIKANFVQQNNRITVI